MELAPYNLRVNMINADAIFDDHPISSGLWDVVGPDRMRSRNLDPEGLQEYYRNRNLLKTEVLGDHGEMQWYSLPLPSLPPQGLPFLLMAE